jgi:hypothetical protein
MSASNAEKIENWIAVTGVIRSGTTFVGKVLSLPLSVDYIHEPFNGGWSLPEERPFRPRYVRPGRDGEATRAYREHLAHLFRYDFALNSILHDGDPWHKWVAKRLVGSRGPFYLRLAKLNPFHRAAVIKDPTCRLVTEYLYRTFDVTPVIVVRHPASLAASLRRMGWWPGLEEFARQPDLVEDFFAGEEDFLHRDWPSPLMEAMAHWRASYKMLLAQADRYPDWQVVTHEELCRRPVTVFQRLYEALSLPWSSSVARRIRRLTEGASARPRNGQGMDLRRDSAQIFETRRDAIAPEQRRALFEIVKGVALQRYSRESFAID